MPGKLPGLELPVGVMFSPVASWATVTPWALITTLFLQWPLQKQRAHKKEGSKPVSEDRVGKGWFPEGKLTDESWGPEKVPGKLNFKMIKNNYWEAFYKILLYKLTHTCYFLTGVISPRVNSWKTLRTLFKHFPAFKGITGNRANLGKSIPYTPDKEEEHSG